MAVVLRNLSPNGALKIEVEGGRPGGELGGNFARALQSLVATITSAWAQVPKENRAQDLTVSCRLKATDAGDFAVSAGDAGANFGVTLVWRSSPVGDLPDAGPIPVQLGFDG